MGMRQRFHNKLCVDESEGLKDSEKSPASVGHKSWHHSHQRPGVKSSRLEKQTASSPNRFRRTALARSWRDRRVGDAPQIPSLGNCDRLVFTRSVLKLKQVGVFLEGPSERMDR